MIPISALQQAELDRDYGYYPPTPAEIARYVERNQAINEAAKQFEKAVLEACPAGAKRTAAVQSIRYAYAVVNQAIALRSMEVVPPRGLATGGPDVFTAEREIFTAEREKR